MPQTGDRLVRDALTSPVRITVGEVGAANEDIRQVGWFALTVFCGEKRRGRAAFRWHGRPCCGSGLPGLDAALFSAYSGLLRH